MKLPGGGYAFVRLGRHRHRACAYCTKPHTKLCDAKTGKGTCDIPMCDEHTTKGAFVNTDYCRDHADQANIVKP